MSDVTGEIIIGVVIFVVLAVVFMTDSLTGGGFQGPWKKKR
jgi:hypothetical protein